MESSRKIILYGPRIAPFTEKVRRALELKGLTFELREPTSAEDYPRWSPETGLLPVITIDGELTSDSTAILHRLDELYPEPPLLSRDPVVREQQRNLEDWADESFLWYFMKWMDFRGNSMPTATEMEAVQEAGRRSSEELRGPMARLRRLGAWLRAGGTWERSETALVRGLGDRLRDLTNFLGTRRFFYSDRVSMADLSVYGMLVTLRNDTFPGSGRLLANQPALLAFMARVERETGG